MAWYVKARHASSSRAFAARQQARSQTAVVAVVVPLLPQGGRSRVLDAELVRVEREESGGYLGEGEGGAEGLGWCVAYLIPTRRRGDDGYRGGGTGDTPVTGEGGWLRDWLEDLLEILVPG